MQVRRTASGWEAWAPAKLNLFLEVVAKRADGFHEIETLMCPISLFDRLHFRDNPQGEVVFTCRGITPRRAEGALAQLPEDARNLVVKAVALLRRRKGVASGARIHLDKRIPIAAGLAGGSSDAAAALLAASQAWELNLPQEELQDMAAELGSDIPFFLGEGTAICRARGEQVERLPDVGLLHFVVVFPGDGLSTAAVYGACHVPSAARSATPLYAALRRGDTRTACRSLHNRLQPAAERLSPCIHRLQREFDKLTLAGHQMSGSGTSYFGVCHDARHARRAAARLRARGFQHVFAVRNIR